MISKKRMVVNIIGALLVLLFTIRLVYETYRMFTNKTYNLPMGYKVVQILTVIGYVTIVVFLVAGIFANVTKYSILGLVGIEVVSVASIIIQLILDNELLKDLKAAQIVMLVVENVVFVPIVVVLMLYFLNKISPVITFVVCFGGMFIFLVVNMIYLLKYSSISFVPALRGYIGEMIFYGIFFGLPILAVALERKEDKIEME